MKEIEQYVAEIKDKAKTYLAEEYHLESFKISDFQSINFFLIDKALHGNKSLFIQSYDRLLPSLSQFPAVMAVAFSLFFKNYCDDKTFYELGDIIQKDGQRFTYFGKNADGTHNLRNQFQEKPNVTDRQLKQYHIIGEGEPSVKRANGNFNSYKKLFKLVYNTDYVPSKFNYKAVIILEKKEFEEELKNQTYTDIPILKAIPIRWISKNGTTSWDHLAIEPMIFCVPDYETFREFLLEKGTHIEALIIIGKNKYKDNIFSQVTRDLREEIYSTCLVLGNEPIVDLQHQLLKWRWTYPEFALLENKGVSKITPVLVNDQPFERSIADFLHFLNELETATDIRLDRVKSLRKYLFPLTLSNSKDSRNLNQVYYVKHLIHKVSVACITENLSNQNIDPIPTLEKVTMLVKNIFDQFANQKFPALSSLKSLDYLIVPEALLFNWKNEFKTGVKICSFKEFINLRLNVLKSKQIVFLSIFGNGISPLELTEQMTNSPHQYRILCYREEEEVLAELVKRNFNDAIAEYSSSDRQILAGLSYDLCPKEIFLSDIIENMHSRSDQEKKLHSYEEIEQVNYIISFDKCNETMVCDGSRSVLLATQNSWVKSKISNLRAGDKVRIYNNLSKDLLFDIAAKEDSQGRFREVEQDAKLWKEALLNYYCQQLAAKVFSNEVDLLQTLQQNGLTITNPQTIRKWLNLSDKERFPNASRNLIAIKNTIRDNIVDSHFDHIKQSKRFYRGVMISLGRDLSDEVMEYHLSNGKEKGKILGRFTQEEIKSFVQNASPERIIINIAITEEDEFSH